MHRAGIPLKTSLHFQPVDEVAQVVEQLRVVLCSHVNPGEGRILSLRTDVEEVEPPHVGWNARVFGHVAKHAHATALGELCVLVIQVLCGGVESELIYFLPECDTECMCIYRPTPLL